MIDVITDTSVFKSAILLCAFYLLYLVWILFVYFCFFFSLALIFFFLSTEVWELYTLFIALTFF